MEEFAAEKVKWIRKHAEHARTGKPDARCTFLRAYVKEGSIKLNGSRGYDDDIGYCDAGVRFQARGLKEPGEDQARALQDMLAVRLYQEAACLDGVEAVLHCDVAAAFVKNGASVTVFYENANAAKPTAPLQDW